MSLDLFFFKTSRLVHSMHLKTATQTKIHPSQTSTKWVLTSYAQRTRTRSILRIIQRL